MIKTIKDKSTKKQNLNLSTYIKHFFTEHSLALIFIKRVNLATRMGWPGRAIHSSMLCYSSRDCATPNSTKSSTNCITPHRTLIENEAERRFPILKALTSLSGS